MPALAGAANIKNTAASTKAQRPRIAEATAPVKRFSIARVNPRRVPLTLSQAERTRWNDLAGRFGPGRGRLR